MAWTAFPTWVVGQVSLASDWNTYVAANMQSLATPPLLRVYRQGAYVYTADQTTVVPFDSVEVDTASGFVYSTQLYTIPVAGSYLMTGRMSVGSSARLFVSAYINPVGTPPNGDAEASRGTDVTANSTAIDNGGVMADVLPNLLAGYIVGLFYYCGFAQAADVGPNVQYMSIVKVSN